MMTATANQEHQTPGDAGACMASNRKRLGEILLDNGVIGAVQLKIALAHQRRTGCKLGQALIRLGFATEAQVVRALSRQLGHEAVDVSKLRWTPELQETVRLIPRELAERHLLLPIGYDGASISIAMSEPTNLAVVDEIAFRTGRRVKVLVAGEGSIATAIRKLYGARDEALRSGVDVASTQGRTGPRSADHHSSPSPACTCGRHGEAAEARVLSALTRVLASKGLVTDVKLAKEMRAILGHEPIRSDDVPRELPLRNVG